MSEAAMVVHAGGWEAGLAELQAAPVPETTATYTAVPHPRFVEEVKFNLPRFGLTVAKERYALARDGAQMFGVLDVQNGVGQDGWTMAIGMRNSYDRSFSLGLVAGSRVFVCDNLAFSGEVQVSRKHTANIFRDMPSLIFGMLERVNAHKEVLAREVKVMREAELGDERAHHLLVAAMKRDVIPASTLPLVLREWDEPRHEEFKVRNAWSLFNAFTQVQKERSPRSQFDDTLRLTKLFREEFSIN